MKEIEIGTPVIHPTFDKPLVWEGDLGHPGTRMIAHLREGYTGLQAEPHRVAPATCEVPAKSPRVEARKEPREVSWGPAMRWFGYLDGKRVTSGKDTKREATRVALVTLVVDDFHQAEEPSTQAEPQVRPA